MLGQLLISRAFASIVGKGPDGDASARGEYARHLNIFGVHESYEVFHDDVDTILVKVAVISETEEIELQALALHHFDVGNVGYAYLCKVWLSRDGA